MGIIQHHQKRFHNKEMKSECLMTEKEKVEMITLIHMQTGFYLLAIGYLLALFSLIVEIIVKFRQSMEQNLALQEKDISSQEMILALKEKDISSQEMILALKEKDISSQEMILALREKLNSLHQNNVDSSIL